MAEKKAQEKEVKKEAREESKAKSAKKKVEKKAEKKIIFTVGKRKKAVARAVARPGNGKVLINSQPLDIYGNELIRTFIKEPLLLSDNVWKGFDFSVNVKGGGIMGQAEAIRQSIARAIVEIQPGMKKRFLEYDRNLLIYDSRRTEPHKPPRSSQGPRRYKQRSKR